MLKDVINITILNMITELFVSFVNLNIGYLVQLVLKYPMKILTVISSHTVANVENVKMELISQDIVKYALLFNKPLDKSLNDNNYIQLYINLYNYNIENLVLNDKEIIILLKRKIS